MPFIPRHWRLALLLALLMQALPSTMPVVGSIQPALADDDGGGDGGGGDSGDSGDGGSGDGGSDDGGSGDGGSGDGGGTSGGGDAGGGNSGAGEDTGGGGNDHEYAWRERRAGHIRSLKEVLENLRKQGVTVLDVKLRREGGHPRYEIRLLDRRNRLRVKSLPARRRSRKAYNFNRD